MICLLSDCSANFQPRNNQQLYCSSSHQTQASNKRHRAKQAEWVRQLKVSRGCADCGWNEHHAGLDFDHLENRNQDINRTIAKMMGKASLGKVKQEIEKCEIVCKTCHGIRTWQRNQPGSWSMVDNAPDF